VASAPRPHERPQKILPMVNMPGLTEKAIKTAPMIHPRLLMAKVFLRPIRVKSDPPSREATRPPIQNEDTANPLESVGN
jgi:hypothetical protein